MQRVKNIWKARGNWVSCQYRDGSAEGEGWHTRHATSLGAKEKPRVSQLLMLNPVIQFAIWMMTSLPRERILLVCTSTKIRSAFLSSQIRIRTPYLCLPNTSRSRVHPSPKAGHDTANIHLRHTPAGGLNHSTNSDDRGAEQDLSWSSENVSRDDGAEGPDETANVVDRGHGALRTRRWLAKGLPASRVAMSAMVLDIGFG